MRAFYLTTLVLAFILPLVLAQSSVTSVAYDGVSHSVARIITYVSNGDFSSLRLLYNPTSKGTCDQGLVHQPFGALWTDGYPVVIGGLDPDTEYSVCPQVLTQGNWVGGATATFRTNPLPVVYPALPVSPQEYDTTYPDTTGYTYVNIKADCSDFRDALNTAVANQADHGTILLLPAGTVCADTDGPFVPRTMPPDVIQFQASDVSLTDSSINIPNHPFTEGSGIIFARNGYNLALPSPSNPECPTDYYGAIATGSLNHVHVVDKDHIQVYCGNTSALAHFVNAGSVGSGHLLAVPYPRKLNWIIIRTATSDDQFVPEGVRVSSAWQPKMASFVKQRIGTIAGNVLWSLSDTDGNIEIPNAKIRFVGIEFTTQDIPEVHTSSDPDIWDNLIALGQFNQEIIFDRCYIHTPGTPHRINKGFYWAGLNVAIVDSYLEKLEYFHSAYWGFDRAVLDQTTFQIGSGIHHLGSSNPTLDSAVNISISGTSTNGVNRIFVYFDMTQNNKFTVAVPQGMTVTCTTACAQASSTTTDGSCNRNDGWPARNNFGWLAAGIIACVDVDGSGHISNIIAADSAYSPYASEGANFMIGGGGPGPYKFENNYLEAVGLTWHHDGNGGDYVYRRNTFHVDPKHQWAGRYSDGMMYRHRQPLEWKGGQRILIEGNMFNGTFSEDNPVSAFVTFTSVAGQISDVNLQYNFFQHGPGGSTISSNVEGGAKQTLPPVRFRAAHNIFWDIDGGEYHTPGQYGQGWGLTGGGGSEDIIIDHNTMLLSGSAGSHISTFIYLPSRTRISGFQITNNLLTVVGDGFQGMAYQFDQPVLGCPNGLGELMTQCALPLSKISNNVFLPRSASTTDVRKWWPSVTNCIYDGDLSDNFCFRRYNFSDSKNYLADFDFSLDVNSCGGCNLMDTTDGQKMGADQTRVTIAQGQVLDVNVDAQADHAVVSFTAPDTFSCSVDYTMKDQSLINDFTRVTQSSAQGRQQSVTLSGLQKNTQYFYRINCAVQQPSGSFTTANENGVEGPSAAGKVNSSQIKLAFSSALLLVVACILNF